MSELLPGVEDSEPLPSAEVIDYFMWLRMNQIRIESDEPEVIENIALKNSSIKEVAQNIGRIIRAQYRRRRFRIIDGED